MFTFLPQLFIILSIVGIVVIVVRKIPGVTEFPVPVLLKNIIVKSEAGAILVGKKIWQFVLEVKEVSKRGATLAKLPKGFPKKFPKIKFPSARNLNFFRTRDTAKFFISQAMDCLEREDYPEAERKFIQAIEKDPHGEEAFAGLGKLYLQQNNLPEAIETYKYLVKMRPENDNYFSSLGRAYHNQKLYPLAVEAYEQAIALAPDDAKRYVNLGSTLEAEGHLEEAILNYRKALDLEKNNINFLSVLSEALIKKGEKKEASETLERILHIDPTNQEASQKLMDLKF